MKYVSEKKRNEKNFDFIKKISLSILTRQKMTIKKRKKKGRKQRDRIESQFEFIRIHLNGKKEVSKQNQVEQIYVYIYCVR